MNPTRFLREGAARHPDEPAVFRRGGRDTWDAPITHRQLDRTVDRVVARVRDAGLAAGGRASIAHGGHYPTLVLVLALGRLGVGMHLSADAADVDATFTLPERTTPPGVRRVEVDATWFEPPADDEPVPVAAEFDDPDAIGWVTSSSGTTGRRKLIGCSYRVMEARMGILRAIDLPPRPRTLCPQGPFSGYALRGMLHALALGGSIVIARHVEEAVGAIERLGVQVAILPPNVLASVIAQREHDAEPPGTLYHVESGGSRLARSLLRRAQATLCRRIGLQYGSAEAGPVAFSYVDASTEDSDLACRILPGVDVEAVDDQDRPVASGSTGAIRIRGAGCVSGYLGDPASTASAFRGGWFYPGDRGEVSTAGDLRIAGRDDEIINAGGRKVLPAAAEEVLRELPGVADAAVFAVPDSTGLDTVCAAIVVTPEFDAKVFRQACYRALGALRPAVVLTMPALPRNANGKVLRGELVDLVRARHSLQGG